MKVLRTPEICFENLDDFPFVPNYLNIIDSNGTNMRMHYIDEGDPDGEIILCVHGQPVWSYSFRKMVRPLAEAGFRVVVPDLVGFGRSDKPSERSDYTFASHVDWFDDFVIKLNLSDINLLCQDWGGPISLRVVARDPSKFSRIVATNTGLGDGTGIPAEKISVLRQLLNETPVLSLYEVTAMMKAGGGALDLRLCTGCATAMLILNLIRAKLQSYGSTAAQTRNHALFPLHFHLKHICRVLGNSPP